MSFEFADLESKARTLMVEELERDIAANALYISPRLSPAGVAAWPVLLRGAIESGDEVSLALSVRNRGLLVATETRQLKSGKVTTAKVPETAADTLAEGEFNRFYIRGICRRALSEQIENVIVYRAKPVRDPRPESSAKIGMRVSAQQLLEDLRMNPGVDTALGLPPGPNSGLTIRLP